MKHFLALFTLTSSLNAQTSQSTVELPSSDSKAHIAKQKQVTNSNETLVPSLRGLIIGVSEEAVMAKKQQQASGITSLGFDAKTAAVIEKTLHPYLEKSVSLQSLDKIARELEAALGRSNPAWQVATFPAQEITDGIIAIQLITPTIGSTKVLGNIQFGKTYLRHAITTRPGDIASQEQVRKDIEFLQSNPFRKASAIWQPDAIHKDKVDLLYRIQEKRPWSVFTGFDNYASDRLGNERLYVGGKWGNVLERDHRLTWLLMSSIEENALHAGNLSYQIPLAKRRLLQFAVSASESNTSSAESIDQNGEFFSTRIHLQSPLPDVGRLQHSLKTGIAWRDNSYRIDSGGNEETTQLRSLQWESSWEGSLADRKGSTHFVGGLLWNPGETFSSSDQTYQSLGADDADSLILTLQLDRSIPLADWGALDLKAEMQWSDQSLLASDQYYATGYNRVRGFDESKLFSDRAMFFSAEWKAPRQDLAAGHSLQPVIFADAAWLDDDQTLASSGIGLRWNWKKSFYGRADLAFPLTEIDHQHSSPELHFSLNTFW